METLTTAYLFGLSVAVPFGPISMMIVVNAVRGGPALGLAVAFGCTTGGLLLSTMILATVTVVGGPALERLAGGGTVVAVAVFAFLGVRQLRAALAGPTATLATPGVATPFSTALALALTNPLTVVPFLAFLTAAVANAPMAALPLVPLAVAAGQLSWYVTLSFVGGRLRPYLGRVVPVLQLAASVFLFACGVSLALPLLS